ncbi:MAG TPA: right-handed parallel beta-helix repeat-containing protein [Flavitalea sp.]|nr:right-handed parallel beta-helix repeat-containing protein [Flavitalea sp.]
MIKISFSIFFMLAVNQSIARNFYVSTAGNDANTGTKQSPWKSIEKVNAFHFEGGDSIFFKRGDRFYGSLTCQSGQPMRPVVYSDYSSGKLPVITGFKTIDDWIDTGNGVFESRSIVSNLETVNMVLINGRRYAMGRYPNSDEANGGFLVISSHSANKSIRSAESIAGNFSGGVVVIRKKRWVFDRNRIESNSAFAIEYSPLRGSAKQYQPEDGYGFFIQDHPKTLDQYGEWCNRGGKLQVYHETMPSDVKAATIETIVTAKDFVVINNLRLEGANENVIEASGQGIIISNCEIFFAGKNGISVRGGKTAAMQIKGNNIQFSNNCAISTYPGEFSKSFIQANLVLNNGLVAGAGESGDLGQEAIAVYGMGNTIEDNRIVNSGYTGIRFSSSKNVGGGNIIRRNYIDSFCLVKDDGAGIYTWNNSPGSKSYTTQTVSNNIILNAIGNSKGSKSSRPEAYGIYIDDNASNIDVIGNTVANTYFGIFNHNGHHSRYIGNTLYNNHAQAVWSRDRELPIEDLQVEGNIFFSKADQNTARFWDLSGSNTISSFGTFDNNYYCNPYEKEGASINVIEPKRGGLNSTFTLDQWKAAIQYGSKDKASKVTTYKTREHLVFNASNKPRAFPLNKKCMDLKGKSYTGKVQLEPFSSVILFEPE